MQHGINPREFVRVSLADGKGISKTGEELNEGKEYYSVVQKQLKGFTVTQDKNKNVDIVP